MRVIDHKAPATFSPSLFLHGLTGAGKSTWATTGGVPLVITTEPKAASVLQTINPAAIGLVPESLKDIQTLFEMLGQPDRLAAKGIDRIVLDSFTELTYGLPRWMKEEAGQHTLLTRLELREYGDLRDYSLGLVKAIQLTGYPAIVIARSLSKKVGLVERIVPDGAGKSVDELPGKLLPTAEARFDHELGYVIDTTPAEHSQRCGLPWVPQVYQGTVLDYLALIARKPTAEPSLEPTPEVGTPAYQRAFGEMTQEIQAEKIAEAKAKSEEPGPNTDFVNAVAAGNSWLKPEDVVEITDAAYKGKVNLDQLAAYLHKKGWMPDVKDWCRIHQDARGPMSQHLTEPKLTAFKAHLKSHFGQQAA